MSQAQRDKCAVFAKLHKGAGIFVIPNPFDVGSALYLESLKFKALATSSAGAAWTMGLADNRTPRGLMLRHIGEVCAATSVPVNADYEACYGRDEEGVAESVALCVEAGVAGLSIEDMTGDPANPFYTLEEAVRRMRAAKQAIRASGTPVLLTARSECVLGGHAGGLKEALRRVETFVAEGADVIFVPGLKTIDDVKAVVKAAGPKPVNAIASMNFFTLRQLEDAGVRRVSVGSSLARSAWGGFTKAAQEIASQGTFEAFAHGAPFAEVNGFFAKRKG
jgi:2-methylisocitrate lyase-like PEP mutase family enzyme